MILRRLHRANAALLGLFLAVHLVNHAALFWGHASHGSLMQALRPFYRHPVVEPVLITLFVAQIGLGLALAWRRGRPQAGWAWVQLIAGLYLALFLVQHVPAVLLARPQTETGTAFAAAVVKSMPAALYFVPYYVLAVTALAAHVAAALHFAGQPLLPASVVRALPWAGFALGVGIVFGLTGKFG
jgi:succinate dehydrogenase/fumarate reductase cytochrome b subunit